MKNFFPIVLLVSILLGAVSLEGQTYDQLNVQLQFFNHYGKAYKRGSLAPSYMGSEYYNDEWMPMDVKFKDTLLRFDAVKINLINSNIELLYNGEEKMVANHFFEYVLVPDGKQNKLMVSANFFSYDNKPMQGFVEVLGTGDAKVLVQHYIFIKEPNAQAHIVGGYTTDRLMKASDNYIYEGGKLTVIKRKKDLQEYYRRRGSALDRYLKDKNFNIKDPYQLLELVETMSKKS